jgi:hypothetical protein
MNRRVTLQCTIYASVIFLLLVADSYALRGDVNGDCTVNIFDLVIVAQNFGKSSNFDTRADPNEDGIVNIFDLVIVAQAFGQDCGGYVNELLELRDDISDVSIPYLDIISTDIKESKDNLILIMRINSNLDSLTENVTYIWLLDTDSNPATGQPHGEVGSEYNLRAVYNTIWGWSGFVDDIIKEGGFQVSVFHKQGSVYLIIPKHRLNLYDSARISFDSFSDQGYDNGPMGILQFNSPSAAHKVHLSTSNDIFSGRTGPTYAYVSKSNPATLSLTSNGQRVDVDKFMMSNSNIRMVQLSGNTLTDATLSYSDNTRFVEVYGFLEEYGSLTNRLRVLVGDLFLGNNVAFVFPGGLIPKNEGNPHVTGSVPLSTMIERYDFLEIMDAMYSIQKELVGVVPIAEPYLYEFNYYLCGGAGQPIGLGYGCIENPANEPHWGVIFHETGHGFTGHIFFNDIDNFGAFSAQNSERFLGLHEFRYSEGFATLNSLYSLYMLTTNPDSYKVQEPALSSMRTQFENDKHMRDEKNCNPNEDPCSLYDYEQRSSPFNRINPNIIDGIFIEIAEDKSMNPYGWGVYKRFYKVFLPTSTGLPPVNANKGDTFFVAALSAATGSDLRAQFKEWNFPVDDVYYNQVYPTLVEIIGG